MDKISKVFHGKLRIYILCFLSIIVLISVGRAFQQSQEISFDFHFSPAKLVSEGINHYEYILDGKHDEKGEQDFYMKGSIDEVVAKVE